MNLPVPFYNFINVLSVGVIFLLGLVVIDSDVLFLLIRSREFYLFKSFPEVVFVLVLLCLLYEVGYVINRIGSVLLENILIKVHFIKFVGGYEKYNKAKKEYPIMEILSREYAASRTRVVLFGILFAYSLCMGNTFCSFILFFAIGFYLCSLKKHSSKIVELILISQE